MSYSGDANYEPTSAPCNDANENSVVTAPVAVSVRLLSASSLPGGVLVRWRTASEIDTLGFNVYRQLNGQRLRVNTKLIATKGAGSYSTWTASFLGARSPATGFRS